MASGTATDSFGSAEATQTDAFRALIQRREDVTLAPNATRSYPAARRVAEPDSPLRTPFQRDRDRIVHSKAFRRLKHKTQVFIAPEGDHFRTRLTHTLETCGVARTVARALQLNEDLTEAIGLGHDLGHPPFGHIGEAVLDECLRERFGREFHHNHHSLRMVDALERDGVGLNLTEPVRDGILRHTGPDKPATLEGRIVRIVDRIAYINHDIDDAVRAGVIAPADLPNEQIAVLGETPSERIDTLVRDLVETSSVAGDIEQSGDIGGAMLRLRKYMFDNVYLGPQVRAEQGRVTACIRGLFEHYVEHPEEIPAGAFGPPRDDDELAQRVTDWIAGMTDRYAIRAYAELALPRSS
ncbi:MAG TPA: deoxyguanosinetriphosphate triphosphohydrolase [Solirubrobacterales bacterium]|jgi:dGTPase|nr:deoxyguanosinetriphosphate triphosphohydrolase [Solirubrobacterales bacterium]